MDTITPLRTGGNGLDELAPARREHLAVARGQCVNTASILERLTAVKQTAPGRWIARCPAHQDRAPSLSIREVEDGRVLLHCFSGCPTQDVLQAIGLDFGDLYDKPLAHA